MPLVRTRRPRSRGRRGSLNAASNKSIFDGSPSIDREHHWFVLVIGQILLEPQQHIDQNLLLGVFSVERNYAEVAKKQKSILPTPA